MDYYYHHHHYRRRQGTGGFLPGRLDVMAMVEKGGGGGIPHHHHLRPQHGAVKEGRKRKGRRGIKGNPNGRGRRRRRRKRRKRGLVPAGGEKKSGASVNGLLGWERKPLLAKKKSLGRELFR